MIARIFICLCLLHAGGGAVLADPFVDEKHESKVTLTWDGNAIETHITNRRFESASLADDRSGEPKLLRLLVLIEIDRVTRDADDQETALLKSSVRASARPIGPNGLGAPTLRVETDGDEVSTSGSFLIVTRWGCCALQSSHSIYSLLSGARLFSATGEGDYGDWVTLGSRRRPDEARYVAAHVAPTLSDVAELGEDEMNVIAITYADGKRPRQKLVVTAQAGRNSDEVLNWLPELSWVTTDQPLGTDHVFFPSDAPADETYDGILLRLKLDDATQIDIPLKKDQLAVTEAILPRGFGLIDATN